MCDSVSKGCSMSVTTTLLDVCVPSGLFCYRNFKKTENGEVARAPVFVFQGAKVLAAAGKAVNQYDNSIARSASETVSEWSKYTKQYKGLDYVDKGAKWGMNHINHLICAASIYKVAKAKSDDKVNTAVTEAGTLSGMFAGEGWMKENLGKYINEKNVSELAEKLANKQGLAEVSEFLLKSGNAGKVASIAKGVTFVTGSVIASTLGGKGGKYIADKVCPKKHPEQNTAVLDPEVNNENLNFRC